MHPDIINVSSTVLVFRDPGREDDSTGGPLWQWKDYMHQPLKEAVQTPRRDDLAGWETTAPVQTQILASKGTFNLKYIKKVQVQRVYY